ncbi:MAG: sensor histidine kinase [Mycobacteriales bacterium]
MAELWRRWAYLILGGALLTPYFFLATAVGSLFSPGRGVAAGSVVVMVGCVVVVGAGTGALIPAIRVLEVTAAGELLRGPATDLPVGPARSWNSRWRAGGWFLAHVVAGGVVSALTLSVPPVAVVMLLTPLRGGALYPAYHGRVHGWAVPLTAALAAVLLLALVGMVALAGAALTRLAPALLGPSPAEHLAALERRNAELAERNRLARELHDSVGHALSVVTLQAGAAGKVLDQDPEFARRALDAIADAARGALEDLDHVLGVLREDRAGARAPQPTLGDLDRLLEQTRLAGVEVAAEVVGELGQVPPAVSREAYRIVQEGLTNALRHAGRVPVTLRLAVGAEHLELEMTNPLGTAVPATSRGGRGLPGIRERVTVLRGQLTAAAAADGREWRVAVSLPLRAGLR